MQIVNCGNDIFVTGAGGCNEACSQFKRQIHLWHGEGIDPNGTCLAIKSGNAKGLVIKYTDGNSLAAAVSLESIARYASEPGPLLIHCAFGQCRGPTVALLAKIARGVPPLVALQDITAALWDQRRIGPHWCPTPLAEIFEFAEGLSVRTEKWWRRGGPAV